MAYVYYLKDFYENGMHLKTTVSNHIYRKRAL